MTTGRKKISFLVTRKKSSTEVSHKNIDNQLASFRERSFRLQHSFPDRLPSTENGSPLVQEKLNKVLQHANTKILSNGNVLKDRIGIEMVCWHQSPNPLLEVKLRRGERLYMK